MYMDIQAYKMIDTPIYMYYMYHPSGVAKRYLPIHKQCFNFHFDFSMDYKYTLRAHVQ